VTALAAKGNNRKTLAKKPGLQRFDHQSYFSSAEPTFKLGYRFTLTDFDSLVA
jgi:hypothetical protein